VQNIMPVVYYAFAAILVGGGIMGSHVSGKPSSFLGSLAFGTVAVIAGVLARSNPRAGLILGLVDALAVAIFFVYRYSVTGKPMPAFPSIALSAIVIILTAIALGNLGRK
jgi:uncharacterized membrane protein (UPF0136 family)